MTQPIPQDMHIERPMIDDLEIIEFQECGTGPHVIFLHGGPGLYGYMEAFCESIADQCRAVYYEQRGSKQGNIDIGIEDHLRDLKRIVDHYAMVAKPIIVGHSWGAMLALLFAGRHSDSLGKVILIGSGPLSASQGDAFQQILQERFGDRQDYYDRLWSAIDEEQDETKQQTLADHYIEEMMEIYQMDPDSGREIQPRQWDYKGARRTMRESDKSVEENKYVDALAQIKAPLTIIQGTRDVVSPESLFNLARKHVSTVTTFALARAGHYPWAGPCQKQFMEILKQELR